MPCCPPVSSPCSSSFAAPLLGGPREVPGDASPFSHHSLPPSSSSVPVCVSSDGAAEGHVGPPSPMASLPPLPLMHLPAGCDVQGCPADPSPRACLLCLLCRQGLISLATATKRVNTSQGISSALHRLFCLLLN